MSSTLLSFLERCKDAVMQLPTSVFLAQSMVRSRSSETVESMNDEGLNSYSYVMHDIQNHRISEERQSTGLERPGSLHEGSGRVVCLSGRMAGRIAEDCNEE